jgi:hypothetical protein
VAERFNAPVLKTGSLQRLRGFESHPLRCFRAGRAPGLGRSSESSRSNPRDLRRRAQGGFEPSDKRAHRCPTADSRDHGAKRRESHPLRNTGSLQAAGQSGTLDCAFEPTRSSKEIAKWVRAERQKRSPESERCLVRPRARSAGPRSHALRDRIVTTPLDPRPGYLHCRYP